MVNVKGLTALVAKLCGGEHCTPVDRKGDTLSISQLRSLIYRRFPEQMFSAASVIASAIDGRPSPPPKQVREIDPRLSRLLSHFRAVAATGGQNFFAVPMAVFPAETSAERYGTSCECVTCFWIWLFYLRLPIHVNRVLVSMLGLHYLQPIWPYWQILYPNHSEFTGGAVEPHTGHNKYAVSTVNYVILRLLDTRSDTNTTVTMRLSYC